MLSRSLEKNSDSHLVLLLLTHFEALSYGIEWSGNNQWNKIRVKLAESGNVNHEVLNVNCSLCLLSRVDKRVIYSLGYLFLMRFNEVIHIVELNVFVAFQLYCYKPLLIVGIKPAIN